MVELFRANIVANLAFYRRSRLLLAFAMVFLLLTGLRSLPSMFTQSGVQRFNTLQEIFGGLNFFLLVLAAGLGLFIISSHLRNRSLKMVFTKPCTPAVWLASAFLTAVLVTFVMSCVLLGSATILSLIWGVPVRAGLLFVSADTFVASVGLIAYLMLLGMLAHPAIAVVFALIFNGDLFYGGQVWALATIRSGQSSLALRLLARVFHFLYLVLPMVHPFSEKTDVAYTSLRVTNADWKYILYSVGYALTLSAFCYFASLFALQRKNHI
ncbi:MAG TPA: hypothetical protein VG498_04410 [Terriglobales bacterium]|nr:hypothetical protein [Terriglobales bacterium]